MAGPDIGYPPLSLAIYRNYPNHLLRKIIEIHAIDVMNMKDKHIIVLIRPFEGNYDHTRCPTR